MQEAQSSRSSPTQGLPTLYTNKSSGTGLRLLDDNEYAQFHKKRKRMSHLKRIIVQERLQKFVQANANDLASTYSLLVESDKEYHEALRQLQIAEVE